MKPLEAKPPGASDMNVIIAENRWTAGRRPLVWYGRWCMKLMAALRASGRQLGCIHRTLKT
jgi:hypothetical protein